MASSYSPIWKRWLYKTPLCKKCPGGNYHFFTDTHCFCRVNEYHENWHGGIYLFETGEELELENRGDKSLGKPIERPS